VDFLSLIHHDITEILFKVALNTIALTLKPLITVNKSRQTSNILAASSEMYALIKLLKLVTEE
jgi:hypothetical protein